jgi:hypothetical protein
MTAEDLGWARNGTLRSLDHLAVVEPYQTVALCGVGIAEIVEIRPLTSTHWCRQCMRKARLLGIDASDVGIPNDLVAS